MGIDYGRGQTNIDDEGIRYGVISTNNLQSWIYEMDWQHEEFIACPYCGSDLEDDQNPEICPDCGAELRDGEQNQTYEDGPLVLHGEEVEAIIDTNGDMWIFKSGYTVKAGFCSPCAPGAVYLTDTTLDAIGYAPPPEWLEDGVELNYVGEQNEK